MTNPPTQPGTQALDNRAEEQELNRLYDAIDTVPATRGTIDKMLADAEASGDPISHDEVFTALKGRSNSE